MGQGTVCKELVNYIFDNYEGSNLTDKLQKLLEQNGSKFDIEVAECFADIVEWKLDQGNVTIETWLKSLGSTQSLLAGFLLARMAIVQGRPEEAIKGFSSIIEAIHRSDPLLLLHRARLFVRTKQFDRAADDLKSALSLYPDYSFFVKCEKLLIKVLDSGEWVPRRKLKIAVLSSTTTSFLVPILQASCFRSDIYAEFYEGNYGAYQQEILNSESGLYTFAPDVIIIVPNHRDLAIPPVSAIDLASHVSSEIRNLWTTLLKNHPCQLIQVGFDLPPDGAWGALEDLLQGGRGRVIQAINFALSKNTPSGVSFIDIGRIAYKMGSKFRSDISWYQAKQYPSADSLPLLADYLCAHIRAAFGFSAKVLVLDLDNTLWGGVIGEDGVSGIVLGPPSAEGEAYLDFQLYAKELKERGVLLAVCSKNNLVDAELPFKQHDSMLLKLDDFVMFTANWQDKATNLRNMASQLSIGLDSFVFVDDNPLERAWVRSNLQQVIVPECGNKPWEMLDALRRGMFFESIALTEEDLARHKNYQSNVERTLLGGKACSLAGFLQGLEMVAECGPVDDKTINRAAQLINKTNQFNLTTKRYSEEQVKMLSESPEWWTRWFRLKDKFGDHGLIGIILVKKNGIQWDVDSWLMSCRVLGRNMEEFMCAEMLAAAKAEGAKKVCGQYIPTAKNGLVKDMYANLGFTLDDQEDCYSFSLEKDTIPICQFISFKEKPHSSDQL